jgi:hypothetical protein
LSVVFLAAALAFVLSGRSGDDPSQFLLGGLSLVFILSALRYLARVEARSPVRMLPFSIIFWSATWLIEAVILHSGLPGGRYAYGPALLARLRIGSVPVIVPTLWTAFAWMAKSINAALGQIPAADRGRIGGGIFASVRWRGILGDGFLSGLVFVSVAFALEWHFSRTVGFWTWEAVDPRFSLDGVPMANFILWFAVGALASMLDSAVAGPPIHYRGASPFDRRLPAYGLCALLVAGTIMNFAQGFNWGGWGCVLGLVFWVEGLIRKRR